MHVCDQCGEVFQTTKKIDFAYSTETRPDGSKTILTEPRDVSPCCEAGFETFVENE
jgi:hypothetical protein